MARNIIRKPESHTLGFMKMLINCYFKQNGTTYTKYCMEENERSGKNMVSFITILSARMHTKALSLISRPCYRKAFMARGLILVPARGKLLNCSRHE